MTFAVIDTNVIVAALLAKHEDTATVQVMTSILNRELTPVYSEPILAEYRDVLQRRKFKFPPEDQEYIISATRQNPILPRLFSLFHLCVCWMGHGELFGDDKIWVLHTEQIAHQIFAVALSASLLQQRCHPTDARIFSVNVSSTCLQYANHPPNIVASLSHFLRLTLLTEFHMSIPCPLYQVVLS